MDDQQRATPADCQHDDLLPGQNFSISDRQWFAIAAFPLVAGTFGPVATAMNICALVQPWRETMVPGPPPSLGDSVADPRWSIGVNALSLCFGMAANASLFALIYHNRLRARALRIVVLNVVGGDIACLSLTALLIGVTFYPQPVKYAHTQAFYYAIMSAVLYFVTSSLMTYTLIILYFGRIDGNIGDAREQRIKGHHRLMLLTVIFMAYILLGGLAFSRIEGWQFLDGVYWADVTLLTVGLGDFSPKTHRGRSLFIPYAACGVCILFSILFCISTLVLEQVSTVIERALRNRARERNKRRKTRRLEEKALKMGCEKGTVPPQSAEDERKARKEDFNLMRRISRRSARRYAWYSVAIWLLLWGLLWVAGSTIFWITEHNQWSYFGALYFSFATLMVVGYGDLTPQNNASKPFFVLWSLFAVPTVTTLITTIAKAFGTTYLSEDGWIELFVRSRTKNVSDDPTHAIAKTREEIFSSPPPRSAHEKNLLLAQALRSVVHSHLVSENPEFNFEDWEYLFYLMGESSHPLDVDDPPQSSSSSLRRGLHPRLEEWKDERGVLDWLHPRNPLNTSDPVAEWMLLVLVEKLELELYELKTKDRVGRHLV